MIERVYSCRNGKVNKIFELGEWRILSRYDFNLPYFFVANWSGTYQQYYKITKGEVVEVAKNDDQYGAYVVGMTEITNSNLNKYRNTYNSSGFRFKSKIKFSPNFHS